MKGFLIMRNVNSVNHIKYVNCVNIINHVISVRHVNCVNSVNSVNSVNMNDESWKELFLFGQKNVICQRVSNEGGGAAA